MSRSDFTTVRVVGGLLPTDLLGRVLAGDKDLGGLAGAEYHLAAGETPREAANRAWPYLLGAWTTYRQALAKLPEGDPAVGLTREKWLNALFKELDYGRLQPTPAGGLTADDKSFPVSHLWGATPLHLLGWGVELDKRTKGVPGAAERAPQAMLQELLNRSDSYLWGMLSNGRTLRLLRDSTSLAGQSYVEFDLESMFDGEVFSDFVLLYLLLHQSRVEVLDGGIPADCWLEKWRTSAAETGTRALGLLRDGVKDALEALGSGFLQAPGNDLSDRLASGTLRLEDYQRSLLRLVYRLLFLFVSEDRGLLLDPNADPLAVRRYQDYYSTARLRTLARKRRGARHVDQWQGLQLVIDALGREGGLPQLGLPGLGGIFTSEPVDVVMGQNLPNEALLTAVRKLSVVHPKGSPPRVVDYRNLGAEELGSIYESLLELVPRHDQLERTFTLELLAGNDRKTSGSYYTPTSLIDLVLDEALDPLLDERERQGEEALLSMTVCDPACGSGHFLVAAARRIATRLATVRTGEADPTPSDVQRALHDVVARCIYGVDLNPMAAELAKVSLWLEAMEPGRPLGFLDAHIKVGNALLGATPALIERGIPDAAFAPLPGDDRSWATALKRRNRVEREQAGQGELFARGGLRTDNTVFAALAAPIDQLEASTLQEVHEQARRFQALQQDPQFAQARLLADAWCAAFVQSKAREVPGITQGTLQDLQDNAGIDDQTRLSIERLAVSYRFFHWHLEFPTIFRSGGSSADPVTGWNGGFDCLLGNPPWEQVQLDPNEWFASRDASIAAAINMTARNRLIKRLEREAPELWREFTEAQRTLGAFKHFVHASNRYPLTAFGRLNTYSLFAELFATCVQAEGQAGIITPTGLMTDSFNQYFAAGMLKDQRLAGFTDFENSRPLFDSVHRSFRFAVTCLTGPDRKAKRIPLAFIQHDPMQVHGARFELTRDEIVSLNPNTGTLPVFSSRRDAEIALKIYRRFPVLIKEPNANSGALEVNPWGLKFKLMFMMNTDSDKFRTLEELEHEGYILERNVFIRRDLDPTSSGPNRFLPLYEAKMMNMYDHRFATHQGATGATLPAVTERQHDDPDFEVLPRYWVAQHDVARALGGDSDYKVLFGWRDITNSGNSRTVVASAIPATAVSNKLPLVMARNAEHHLPLQVAWSSLVFDYLARQKVNGTSLNFYLVNQFACPTPNDFAQTPTWLRMPLASWIQPRALELIFTSNSVAAVARNYGDDGPPFRWIPARRQQIRCELDAAMLHLYGLARDEVEHVLDSFSTLCRSEERDLGEFRTRRLVLAEYDRMRKAATSGLPYESTLDPAPGLGPRHNASTIPAWFQELT